MSFRLTRRYALSGLGVALTGSVAGCLSGDEGSDYTNRERTNTSSAETPAEPSDDNSTADPQEPSDDNSTVEPQDVSFMSPSGPTVEGTLYGRGSCGVVLVPQINRDRGSWYPQAERLAEQGHVALPIDEGDDRVEAVLGAVEYLRAERNVSHVVVMGASTGGEAVVTAAATEPDRIDGVVALSASGGVDRADQLTGQKLFVVSRDDEQRFVDIATGLTDSASEPSQLETYNGGAHGQGLFESSHRKALWDTVLTLTTAVCQDE